MNIKFVKYLTLILVFCSFTTFDRVPSIIVKDVKDGTIHTNSFLKDSTNTLILFFDINDQQSLAAIEGLNLMRRADLKRKHG